MTIRFLGPFIWDVISRRKRSFHQDGIFIVSQMGVPLKILEVGLKPTDGSGILVFNHYSREEFSIVYAVAAIAAAIPVDMHWIMTAGWTFPGNPFRKPLRRISEWFFRRVASVYGFTLTPPLPPDPSDQPARTAAIRKVFEFIKLHPGSIVALAPEGQDFSGGILGEPPPGSGKFLLALSCRLGNIIPVGVYEEEGCLTLRFGQPFDLYSIIEGELPDLDRAVARIVMERIAELVPDRLAGAYKN